MIGVKLISVGTLKEEYWRDAFDEYSKRLGAFCRFESVQLKEERLPENPSESEIRQALEKEGARIVAELPTRAYRVAMCVEGKTRSSEELARLMEDSVHQGGSHLVFLIGGSFGLHPSVKALASFKLSMSPMTFPHHLARVMLLEQIYRGYQINNGSKYHK
jgi:23S rRNA (pseudouridine1915-N3)-methyltransferase